MEKRKATNRFQRRRTLRLTAEEDERILRQAETAGISVSEYMRRLFFGGRPIIARTDDQTIRELRRLGGLLKHNFALASEAHQSELWMVRGRHADFNQSMLEASTALHLRCAGYLRKEVEEEMREHTLPAHSDDLLSKIGYLQRILDYAFGACGGILVIGQKLGKTEVEKFNKEAEVIDYYMKNPQSASSQQRGQHRLKIR